MSCETEFVKREHHLLQRIKEGGKFKWMLLPILGVVALLVSGIGLIVVSIAKLVYLYRTANVFRNYTV